VHTVEYLLGIDIGTSGTKTVLFDTDGNTAASKTVEYPMSQPQNGWAEQRPEDWWMAAQSTIHTVIAESGVDAADIAAYSRRRCVALGCLDKCIRW